MVESLASSRSSPPSPHLQGSKHHVFLQITQESIFVSSVAVSSGACTIALMGNATFGLRGRGLDTAISYTGGLGLSVSTRVWAHRLCNVCNPWTALSSRIHPYKSEDLDWRPTRAEKDYVPRLGCSHRRCYLLSIIVLPSSQQGSLRGKWLL